MRSAATIRVQIESALANRFPSALTPAPKIIRPTAPTGIAAIDHLLEGGLPVGAITEIVGPESSGRTSLALSLLAGMTRAGKVTAWIDVSNSLHPETAAEAGVDLTRLIWVRCGGFRNTHEPQRRYSFKLAEKYLAPSAVKNALRGGGFGAHPRTETKGMPDALNGSHDIHALGPRCAEPQTKPRPVQQVFQSSQPSRRTKAKPSVLIRDPRAQIRQALYVTDQLLRVGGFSALVLDIGSIAPEHASQVVMEVWFRLRAAAEQAQACLILLTQHCCAKSSAELLLRLRPARARTDRALFTGMEHHLEVERIRFARNPTNLIPLKKPPESAHSAHWQSRTTWADAL